MNREPLDADRLRGLLGDRWPAVDVVDETASTNADLLAAAAAGAADRSLLVAEHQVSGRGRFDRVWASPPRAGLTFSVLVRPAVAVSGWGWLPLLAGVALLQAVRQQSLLTRTAPPLEPVLPFEPVLKWPNDLLAHGDGGKLAGILAQSTADAVVIGIGLNVSTVAAELPHDAATSLLLCDVPDVDRTALLAGIAQALDDWLQRWQACHGDAVACGLAGEYRRSCTTVGRRVRAALGDGRAVSGTAVAVDDLGGLVLDTGAGVETVVAADVEHLRPI